MEVTKVKVTSSILNHIRKDESKSSGIHPNPKPKEKEMMVASPLSLSISKPSWVVRTESNIRKGEQVKKKAEAACVVCGGTGRVDCYNCCGKGRTNKVDMDMLPKGEWPKWCRCCGGSGLTHCSRCLGTGEYRYVMGFQFMNTQSQRHPH